MNRDILHGLLYEALETEQGGVQVYETALRCAVDTGLEGEWGVYLEQTKNHVRILSGIIDAMGLDPAVVTSGRLILRSKTRCLLEAMEQALKDCRREAAQLVAAECVIDAETKDRQNWELLGEGLPAPVGP